MNHKKLHP